VESHLPVRFLDVPLPCVECRCEPVFVDLPDQEFNFAFAQLVEVVLFPPNGESPLDVFLDIFDFSVPDGEDGLVLVAV
jgi:hypothetical protein